MEFVDWRLSTRRGRVGQRSKTPRPANDLGTASHSISAVSSASAARLGRIAKRAVAATCAGLLAGCNPLGDEINQKIKTDFEQPIFFVLPQKTCQDRAFMGTTDWYDGLRISNAASGTDFEFTYLPKQVWFAKQVIDRYIPSGIYRQYDRGPSGPCYRWGSRIALLDGPAIDTPCGFRGTCAARVVPLGAFSVRELRKVNEFSGTDPKTGYSTTFRSYQLSLQFVPNETARKVADVSFSPIACAITLKIDQTTKEWTNADWKCP